MRRIVSLIAIGVLALSGCDASTKTAATQNDLNEVNRTRSQAGYAGLPTCMAGNWVVAEKNTTETPKVARGDLFRVGKTAINSYNPSVFYTSDKAFPFKPDIFTTPIKMSESECLAAQKPLLQYWLAKQPRQEPSQANPGTSSVSQALHMHYPDAAIRR